MKIRVLAAAGAAALAVLLSACSSAPTPTTFSEKELAEGITAWSDRLNSFWDKSGKSMHIDDAQLAHAKDQLHLALGAKSPDPQQLGALLTAYAVTGDKRVLTFLASTPDNQSLVATANGKLTAGDAIDIAKTWVHSISQMRADLGDNVCLSFESLGEVNAPMEVKGLHKKAEEVGFVSDGKKLCLQPGLFDKRIAEWGMSPTKKYGD